MLLHYTPQVRWNSLFDRAFDDVWPFRSVEPVDDSLAFVPRVDIREAKDALVLTVELPGVDKDAITVEVHDRVLTIAGEKKSAADAEENGVHRAERAYGAFKRSFTLPETLDTDRIDAAYENGVLSLTLSKRPEASPKQIPIQVGTVKQIETKN